MNARVYNNTFLEPTGTAPTVKFIDNTIDHTPGENIEFFNNIVLSRSSSQCVISSTTTMDITSDYNLFWAVDGSTPCFIFNSVTYSGLAAWQAASGQDAHSIVADPLLSTDFSLYSTSPAIDAGDNSICPSDDYSGYFRKDRLCDIGAYEFRRGQQIRGTTLKNMSVR
jgi:hypothetical protein